MDKLHASGDMVLGEDVTCSKTKPCDVAFSLQPHITISHLPLLISIGYINHSICILQPQLALKSITTYLTNNKFEHFDPSSAFKKRQSLGSLARKMAILMPRIIQAKQILRRSLSNGSSNKYMAIPKGYFTVYVGEQEKKRFVVPVSLLDQPAFQELLCQAEEEFGYNHPMGGLTIPCSKEIFIDAAARFGAL